MDVDDEHTPAEPRRRSSAAIHYADLCAQDVANKLDALGIVRLSPMPASIVAVLQQWMLAAVRAAVEPERQECDRLRAELERAEARLRGATRDLAIARNAMRKE